MEEKNKKCSAHSHTWFLDSLNFCSFPLPPPKKKWWHVTLKLARIFQSKPGVASQLHSWQKKKKKGGCLHQASSSIAQSLRNPFFSIGYDCSAVWNSLQITVCAIRSFTLLQTESSTCTCTCTRSIEACQMITFRARGWGLFIFSHVDAILPSMLSLP